MPEMFLCVPEDYYSSEMQAIIAKSVSDSKNRWIYNIIQDRCPHTEIVLKRTPEWTLCRDGGSMDGKWLVVLHDTNIHSLRDLRSSHVPMLIDMREQVRETLVKHYGRPLGSLVFFLHYMPSVFQLHVHVHIPEVFPSLGSATEGQRIHSRRHMLKHVLRNLASDDLYYTKCILLANLCKNSKYAQVYSAMSFPASESLLFK